jgi:hypothetical protein
MQNVNANDNNKYNNIFPGILPVTGNGGKSPPDGNK